MTKVIWLAVDILDSVVVSYKSITKDFGCGRVTAKVILLAVDVTSEK